MGGAPSRQWYPFWGGQSGSSWGKGTHMNSGPPRRGASGRGWKGRQRWGSIPRPLWTIFKDFLWTSQGKQEEYLPRVAPNSVGQLSPSSPERALQGEETAAGSGVAGLASLPWLPHGFMNIKPGNFFFSLSVTRHGALPQISNWKFVSIRTVCQRKNLELLLYE